MRKYIIYTALSFFILSDTNGQDDTRTIIDSAKKELNSAKGNKRIDCLNLLAGCYFDLWDDDDTQLDTACSYADEAYQLAKNSSYKRGQGYALLMKASCFGGRVDDNKKNNNSEVNYTETYNYANKAIQIGEEIKDYRLVGDVYDELKWLERWKGDSAKFKYNVEKAIYYYEKPVTNKLTGLLAVAKCNQCQGNEGQLAWLYYLLGAITFNEKGAEAAKVYIDKSVYYYKIIGTRGPSSAAMFYSQIAQKYFLGYNYKLSEQAYIKARDIYHEAGDIEMELGVMNEMNKVYEACSDFENGIATFKNSIRLIEEYFKDKPAGSAKRITAGQAFFWMSRLYKIAGDYEGALAVIRRGRQYYPGGPDSTLIAPWMAEIGDAHRLLGNFDSAMYYLKGFQNSNNDPNNFGKNSLGYLYLDMRDYSKAKALILPYYQHLKALNRFTYPIVNALNILGNVSMGEKKYAEALQYAKEAQLYLRAMGTRSQMIDNYKLLADIYEKMNQLDSALVNIKQYTQLKDSFINRQFFFKLNSLKNESEEQKKTSLIQLLRRDNVIKEQMLQEESLRKKQNEAELALLDQNNKIKDQELQIKEQNLKEQTLLKDQNLSRVGLLDKENKLKDQRLKQQATIKNALLAGLLMFVALGVFVFRSLSLKRKNERLQNEKQKAELQQKASELEMQALRAQMNPHFIFNCLSSINKFILKNDTDAASDYLTRFSRLIRQSLTNSQLSLVPLSDEIEMLRLYLDMERLRFSDSFKYNISFENSIEPETIYVPPMVLQPFCENAIWHGLMHKDGPGRLEVVLSQQDDYLHCIIADNGIGRAKAAELKSKANGKQKSFGLKITTERLALFNNEKTVSSFYKTDDVLDSNGHIAGTKVALNIKYKNHVHQPTEELHG